MHTLKEVEQKTGIKTDNLRQRIHRKTIKAVKMGRDWMVDDEEVKRLVDLKKKLQ